MPLRGRQRERLGAIVVVPDYQSLMLPMLRLAGDQQVHELRDATNRLAKEFKLGSEDREQLLPSGRQSVFDNRVGWARTYMAKAGLLESAGRAKFRITERGLQTLKQNPARIDVKFLRQFPEFVAFQSQKPERGPTLTGSGEGTQTPEERLEAAHSELRSELADALLERIKQCPPKFFEQLVVDLLVAMDYGGSRRDAQAVGRTGDGGIDGVIKEDRLGLDAVYIQAKRWESSVGRPQVQAFVGSLEGQRAKKGVFITTSTFTKDAWEYVEHTEKKIVLIDGEELALLMIEHNVGVASVSSYDVKKVDLDYFGIE